MIKVFPQLILFFLLVAGVASGQAQEDLPEVELTPEEEIAEQLKQTISTWAGAWQSQLPDLYIAHYTLDYVAPGFADRAAWIADRREKLIEPEFIKLRLIDFELVSLADDLATVRFTLIYERPDYSDQTYKALTLANNFGIWLIEREENLEVTVL